MNPRLLISLLLFLVVSCKETTESKLLNFEYKDYFGKTANDLIKGLNLPFNTNESFVVFSEGYTTGAIIVFDYDNNIEFYLEKPLPYSKIKYSLDDILSRKISRVDVETENYLLYVSDSTVKKEKKKHRE